MSKVEGGVLPSDRHLLVVVQVHHLANATTEIITDLVLKVLSPKIFN
jgi:hypothetical protein